MDKNRRTDRTWNLPNFPWVMRMTWSELLFAHWRVPADQVARWLPPGLSLDTYDGDAWVGVVPFLMSDVAPRGIPAIPGWSRFPELNLRTYVIRDGKPGVWFFSLEATNRLAVRAARALFYLPYMDATMSLQAVGSSVNFTSERTHRGEPPARFAAHYSSLGEVFEAPPKTLEHWLTARYCLYAANRHGHIFRGEIDHDPWPLSKAACEWHENTIGAPWGFEFSTPPHLLFVKSIKVRAWLLERCR
jgi:uncharacterized protein YqjF (DUF2071 family)